MNIQQQKVREWMAIFGQEVNNKFTVPTFETRLLRLRLHREEETELLQAIMFDDKVAVADSCADLLYVLYGTACSYGFEVDSYGIGKTVFLREILQHITFINNSICLHTMSITNVNYAVSMLYAWCEYTRGITLEKVFDLVHTNNMEKFWTTSQIEKALDLKPDELVNSTSLRHEVLNARRPDVKSLWAVTDQHGKVIKPIGFIPVDLSSVL